MKWTQEEEQKLREMLYDGITYRIIAKRLGRTRRMVANKVYYLGLSDARRQQVVSGDNPKAYRDGRGARAANQCKSPPATLSRVAQAWWLAGFHDRDMELGGSVLEGIG